MPQCASPRMLLLGMLVGSVFADGCGDRSDRNCKPEYILPWREDLPLCGNIDINTRTVVHIFAQIGDYGDGSLCQLRVSELMNFTAMKHNKAYRGRDNDSDFDFVFTTGDNAYGQGNPTELVEHVGNIYGKYFQSGRTWKMKDNSTGEFPLMHPEALKNGNRFFPTIGNHDFIYLGLSLEEAHDYLPYTQYFDYLNQWSPPNASYKGQWYTYQISPHVALFTVNSNIMHEDYRDEQLKWLEGALKESNATFKLVYLHHNPVGSATHNHPDGSLRLPYSVWGASAVFAGHVHVYERLECCDDGGPPPCEHGFSLPYFVSGISGNALDGVYGEQGCPTAPGSQAKYVDNHAFLFGVLHVPKGHEATATRDAIIDFCLYGIDKNGTLNDTYTLVVPTPAPTTSPTTFAPSPAPSTHAPTPPPSTYSPTKSPTTARPTTSPTTIAPSSLSPTNSPTTTLSPTLPPTDSPTKSPTLSLTLSPTTLRPTTYSPTTMSPTTSSTTLSPTASSPTTLSPTTSSPSSSSRTTSPTSLAPTTFAPTSLAPTTFSPSLTPTTSPTSLAPTTVSPITVSPKTSSPIASSPTISSLPPTSNPTLAPTNPPPPTNAPTTGAPITPGPTTNMPTPAPITLTPTTLAPSAPPTIHPTTYVPTTSAPSTPVAWLDGMAGSGGLSYTNLLVVVTLISFLVGMLCCGLAWCAYRKCCTSRYTGLGEGEDEGDEDEVLNEGGPLARSLNRERTRNRRGDDDIELMPFREDSQ